MMSKPLKIIATVFLVVAALASILNSGVLESQSNQHGSQPMMSFAEFDEIIQVPIKVISALELAEFLMEQKHHYNLIDLQSMTPLSQASKPASELSNYINSYQIPSSDTHSFDSFLKLKIPVNETIILYSKSEIEATQLYYLLLIRGYFKVKILSGGLQSWDVDILYPDVSTIELQDLKKRQALTTFFGGNFNSSNKAFSIEPMILMKKIKKHKGC